MLASLASSSPPICRLGFVRGGDEQALRPARSAQLRLGQSRRDQRAAHRKQGGRGADARRRRRQGLARGVRRAARSARRSASRTGRCPQSRSRCSSAICFRCSTGSPAARAWRPRRASSSRCTGRSALALGALWLVMALGFRISSLAALTTAALAAVRRVLRVREHADRVGDGSRSRCCCSGATGPTSGSCSKAGSARSAADRPLTGSGARGPVRARAASRDPSAARTENAQSAARRAGQAQRADQRDHRAVVGAELEVGKVDLPAALADRRDESRAQLAIGADAAGDDEPRQTRRTRAPRAPSRRARRRPHAGTRARCRRVARSSSRPAAAVAAHEREHRGLEAAEAHVEVAAVEHRPRQRDARLRARTRPAAPAPARRDSRGRGASRSCRTPRRRRRPSCRRASR